VVDVAREPKEILQSALANAEAAVAVFTADRRFLAVNDRYLATTGISRAEAVAHRAGENLPLEPLDQTEFIEATTSAISAGEADIVRKSGERLAVEYVVIPTRVEGERCFIGMMWPLVVDPEWRAPA
jgi:PAS domain S-box-containing protein